MTRMEYTFRQKIGAALLDWPRYEWRFLSGWLHICNRRESLMSSPDNQGVACQWQWTSDLHAPKVFPRLGARLMSRCLRDWPIEFAPLPSEQDGGIQLSFIIGHRGRERVPLLLATLAAIAAQRGVACECIVVEQSDKREAAPLLPAWVRYVHTPLPDPRMPYCRSWALNVGARAARGKLLVFHDNDMPVPRDYAAELWGRSEEGYEVINLKRFIFYLSASHSGAICAGDRDLSASPPEVIVQNAESGGSIALSRTAFIEIGGYDESFVGWGGEDNEFWQRALTRNVWRFGYLPFVHLWHAPQSGKASSNPQLVAKFQALSSIPPERRIAELVQRKFGDISRMDPLWLREES